MTGAAPNLEAGMAPPNSSRFVGGRALCRYGAQVVLLCFVLVVICLLVAVAVDALLICFALCFRCFRFVVIVVNLLLLMFA